MFTVYHSNQLELHKEALLHLLKVKPHSNPFEYDTILVQSKGMEKWLKMKIADEIGISSNIKFSNPSSFIWDLYQSVAFDEDVEIDNIFAQDSLVWHLMRLIPECLQDPAFTPLKYYLSDEEDQFKRYQLAEKIAELFDQYLMYRPKWLQDWENGNTQNTVNELTTALNKNGRENPNIVQSIKWQAILWQKLVKSIEPHFSDKDNRSAAFTASHRAYMLEDFDKKLNNLSEQKKQVLPQNLIIFGISSFPYIQLGILKKLSEYCHIHLFFTNPSEKFWWGNNERAYLERQAVKKSQKFAEDICFFEDHNGLLSLWGKQGKEFLTLLAHIMPNEFSFFDDLSSEIFPPDSNFIPNCQEEKKYSSYGEGVVLPLLSQLKRSILQDTDEMSFYYHNNTDRSIQFHLCHSEMREVEVLHDQLLDLFAQNRDLLPKDVIVMSPDIDRYAPYINAVFSRYEYHDSRYIPFDISDQKATAIQPIFNAFLHLLKMYQSQLSAEEILALFDVNAIQDKYQLNEEKIQILRQWIKAVNIRFGATIKENHWENYNAWENGLNRLLLGMSLKEQQGIWQDTIAYDESYGLNAELVGGLSEFISHLIDWHSFLQSPQTISAWKEKIEALIGNLFADKAEYSNELVELRKYISSIDEKVMETQFNEAIEAKIIYRLFADKFDNERTHTRFLSGKVNFATLLPMRAIPFKVVCLLGMNEGEFPRQLNQNSFDLMQYTPRLGDRAKREDDRYLFLESVLAAQEVLYISYIGRSLKDNKPLLPSIVVTQLYDYLKQRFASEKQLETFNENNHIVHLMSMLNPDNFRERHFSYQNEWLNLIQPKEIISPYRDFASPIQLLESNSEIELNELIQFISQPVKFFFNKRLGVYFGEQDETIAETENFELDGLQKYSLKEGLLTHSDESEFFAEEKLKGNLTAAKFAEFTQDDISKAITSLKTVLQPYLSQTAENRQMRLVFGSVTVVGNVSNIYHNDIVHWRIGNLRDKDYISAWIYHLCFCALNYSETYRYFYIDEKKQVKTLQFHSLDSHTAQELLNNYVCDFVLGQQQLFMTVNNEIKDYIGKIPEQDIENYCHNKIFQFENSFNNSAKYDKQLPYLKRYLVQTKQLDYMQIHQQTLQWYDEMIKQTAGE